MLSATGCSVLDPNRILTRTSVAPPIPVTPVPMPEDNFRQAAIDFVWTTVNERYYDPGMRRQTAIFLPAEDVIIPYGSTGARTAERVTHLMRKTKNDIKITSEILNAAIFCIILW